MEETLRRLALLILGLAVVLGTTLPAIAAPAPAPEKWALIIGIDRHQGPTRTNVGAVGDANAFHTLLAQNGWPEDHIRMLTDGAATQAAILEGLQWMVEKCGPSTECVVHYSGHTKQMNNAGGIEGPHEYLWPTDGRFISDTQFADYVRQLQGISWIDIAACEAAGFDHGVSSPRRLFTAASAEDEKGYEEPSWRTSVWTGFLVQRALLGGQGDSNGDGHVTLREAIGWAGEQAAQYTTGQQPYGPQHAYSAGGEETNFFEPQAAPARRCLLLNIFCR